MGYRAYGTYISERMVEYSKKNLKWLTQETKKRSFEGLPEPGKARISAPSSWRRATATQPEKDPFLVSQGDAVSFHWQQPINAVACEGYLGKPFSKIPTDIQLKEQKQECKAIVLGFLKNLSEQIETHTPVIIAVPAWLRENNTYERLDIIDEIENMGYNVNNKSREGLLYHRDNQIVARDIIILRKK